MKNRKSFLKGALCGALAMLLVAGLVSCGLKVNNGNSDITSKTDIRTAEPDREALYGGCKRKESGRWGI